MRSAIKFKMVAAKFGMRNVFSERYTSQSTTPHAKHHTHVTLYKFYSGESHGAHGTVGGNIPHPKLTGSMTVRILVDAPLHLQYHNEDTLKRRTTLIFVSVETKTFSDYVPS